MAATFPYAQTERLMLFFSKIQRDLGVPNSADYEWLERIGFEKHNDRRINRVLRFVHFVTDNDQPTQRWQDYRDPRQSKKAMAEGVKQGYSLLFEQYSDAYRCSDDDLRSFFKANTKVKDRTVTMMMDTFKALCALADFGQVPEDDTPEDQKEVDLAESPPPATEPKETPKSSGEQRSPTFSPDLNINVQIHISSDAEPKQIDKIFENMAKYLFNRDID